MRSLLNFFFEGCRFECFPALSRFAIWEEYCLCASCGDLALLQDMLEEAHRALWLSVVVEHGDLLHKGTSVNSFVNY